MLVSVCVCVCVYVWLDWRYAVEVGVLLQFPEASTGVEVCRYLHHVRFHRACRSVFIKKTYERANGVRLLLSLWLIIVMFSFHQSALKMAKITCSSGLNIDYWLSKTSLTGSWSINKAMKNECVWIGLTGLTVMDSSCWHSGSDFAVHGVFVSFFGQISQTWDCRWSRFCWAPHSQL